MAAILVDTGHHPLPHYHPMANGPPRYQNAYPPRPHPNLKINHPIYSTYFPFYGQLLQLPYRETHQPHNHHYPGYAQSWSPFNAAGHYAQVPRAVMQPEVQAQQTNAAVPDAPRGPPRKPKQTGHAVWIGNLPVNTSIHDLKDYCAEGSNDTIESVFLIARSNCAFANYNTNDACEAAMSRFRCTPFHGRQLVSRLRMQTKQAVRSDSVGSSSISESAPSLVVSSSAPSSPDSDHAHPVIVGSSSPPPRTMHCEMKAPSVLTSSHRGRDLSKTPDRYFIVKSLTVQDLIASVNNGTWEAQPQNQELLRRAFEDTDNVYLIFSANKSGEYFGFARMTSGMASKNVEHGQSSPMTSTSPAPRTIATPGNGKAPSGKIYDDSARGTIFWEADWAADTVDSDEDSSFSDTPSTKQFNVQWLSTSRVPFYRCRGLRNPWNGMKEVKIARDGTELEPNVGRQLVRLFCTL